MRWHGHLALVLAPVWAAVPAPCQEAAVSGTVSVAGVPVAGAVVYLLPKAEGPPPRPTDRPVVDQINLRFVPNVLAVPPGTVVEFHNSDPILHNVFSPPGAADGFNLGTYPRGEWRSHVFDDLGAHIILCHVHPEMVAYVLVVGTSYRSVTDQDGRFHFGNVRAGHYTVNVWHRSLQPSARETVIPRGGSLELALQLRDDG